MNKTKIEYLDYTWNPIAMKCSPVSEGCRNCWHLSMAKRLAGNPKMEAYLQRAYAGASPVLGPKELEAPFHLKKPARIGVQFMGDLFHPDVRCEWIDQIWEVMAACRWHTFFVLTKRPENVDRLLYEVNDDCVCRELGGGDYLKNVWFGVSVEDQKTADERISRLFQFPAGHRWISIEPMLGPVDLSVLFGLYEFDEGKWALKVGSRWKDSPDWVVCGCESGPGRRPCNVKWIRNLKNQCVSAGVPFFLKQGPGYLNGKSGIYKMPELDGQTWNEMPDNSDC